MVSKTDVQCADCRPTCYSLSLFMLLLAHAGVWAPRLPTPVLGNLLALSPALLRTLSTFDGPTEPDAQQHDKSYIDRLKVTARAGQGGNGCASFYQGASRGE